MSGSRPTSAEQHLGDRLSALVDGELGHEARDRVLAHLATCGKCKTEADEQRRLKNVFAEAAPPPPSESFLARLQMLPAGGDGDGSPLSGGFGGRLGSAAGGPGLPGSADSRDFADFGVFGTGGDSFGYVPSGPHGGALTPSEGRGVLGGRGFLGDRGFLSGRGFLGTDRGFLGGGRDLSGDGDEDAGTDGRAGRKDTAGDDTRGTGDRGFRIHAVSRPESERSASRGMRFAFVAAGAVSLAAIALGGVTNMTPVETADARGGPGSGSNVTPCGRRPRARLPLQSRSAAGEPSCRCSGRAGPPWARRPPHRRRSPRPCCPGSPLRPARTVGPRTR
ncbi:anti-sigma factor family protein [Streptomyces scabiei]|uniref:anti-sigma factor family protein n=1 Tax=Streptomyces scabiei TaxID=1930 RepID=UPI001FF0B561|nr:zf-HC2 domain-containing protein [Streptomyces sp. LBUM 1480]